MATSYPFKAISSSGLILYIDAANTRSYPGSGTTCTDIVYQYSGTLNNGPYFDIGGGGSLIFDGIDDYIDMGDSNLYSLVSGFTIDLWFKSTTFSDSTFIEKYQVGGYEYIFGIYNSRIYAWVYDDVTGGYIGRSSPINSQANSWINYTHTYDGGLIPTSNKIYVDTIQVDDADFTSGIFNSIQNTTTPLTIANTNGGLGSSINGVLSNIKIYNRVISSLELKQNYEALKNRFI